MEYHRVRTAGALRRLKDRQLSGITAPKPFSPKWSEVFFPLVACPSDRCANGRPLAVDRMFYSQKPATVCLQQLRESKVSGFSVTS